jgi:EAL domain-containing protein (putative c-di-GMP-specific phosphodiesterase class I)/GGDEF domain-containing protein
MLMERLRDMPAAFFAQDMTALMVVHINWDGSASMSLDRQFGDPLLKVISDRLKQCAPGDAFIAHLTGDDFAVLTAGHADVESVQAMAAEFLGQMSEPLAFASEHLLLSPQVGVGIWPEDNDSADQLLRNAYTAMFKSRIDGSERLCIYSGSTSQKLQTRSQLEQALVFALERQEFTMFYQPQVSADDFRIVGAEALIRWNNPVLGWVSPGNFVPVAEHVGLIRSIGAWVMEQACQQLAEWRGMGFDDVRIAINVSPLQFLVPGLENDVRSIVEQAGIEPRSVELEITESSLMQDMDSAVRVMEKIKGLGMELAIDDFGTGYSSLSNLRQFPLDRLKVDQAFTSEIGEDLAGERILQTIIAMGGHLGLELIVEGVETQAQADFLKASGAHILQGYLFGKPMSAEAFTAKLRAQ